MAKRIANNKIILHREGKRVVVKPGELFDFSAAELKELNTSSPTALRKPVNEEAEAREVKAPDSVITNLDETTANPDASVPAPGGKATSETTGGNNKTGKGQRPVAASDKDEL